MSANEISLIKFATEAAERLAAISQGLGATGELRFCAALSATLWLINQQLRDQEIASSELKPRLLKLLSNFEKLCKNLPNPQPRSGASLQSQPNPSRTKKHGLDLATRYPGLHLLHLNNRKYAVEGIRRLATGRSSEATKRQNDLLRILQTFVGPLDAANEAPNPKTKNETWVGDDFTSSIRTLHKVLSEHIVCRAGSEKKEIVGKLRLAVEKSRDDEPPAFNLMFLAHPHHQLREEPFRWRETRICVNKRRKAKFTGATDDEVQLLLNSPSHITDFCERISTREQYQLSLVVSDQQLHFIEWCEGARSWLPSSPHMSLSTILKSHKLSQKMKYLLSYLLAKSVWQFYNTDWMGKEWTKDSIHFMFEHRQSVNNAGVYLNEPFISARFDPDASNDDSSFRPHKFPKIKALGIVLLEIELGELIEDHFDADCYAPDGTLNADVDLYTALRLYDDPDRLEDTFPVLKTVIGECLRPQKFMPHRHSVEELRKVLQEEVVDPLHTLIGLYGQPEKIELRPTVQMKSSQLQRASIQPVASPSGSVLHQRMLVSSLKAVEGPQATKAATFNGSVASSIGPASSEPWFDELDKLKEVLYHIPNGTSQGPKRVRVAVIDTGINGKDPFTRRICGYKDFVTNNDDLKQDVTGHGTNSVKLVYQVYPEAEIYVARVFEHNDANEDTQDLMLEAIQYARKIWNVDIISIASGFEGDHAAMRKAIKSAASDGTLVFAAASNYGNIRQVTFPARMQDVICVYCTDGRAKVSSSINPAPQTTKSRNFAILGEGVAVPPSMEERLTGTSIATSIAAGLAGLLLDFSRQSDVQPRIRCVGNLASIEGMSAVFSHMAKGADDYRYNCVVPGRLLQHLDEEEERGVKRERICERLSTALENIDLDA